MTNPEFLKAYLAERDAPCPKCNYNLRGITLDACPECGSPIELSLKRVGISVRIRRWAFATLVLMALYHGDRLVWSFHRIIGLHPFSDSYVWISNAINLVWQLAIVLGSVLMVFQFSRRQWRTESARLESLLLLFLIGICLVDTAIAMAVLGLGSLANYFNW